MVGFIAIAMAWPVNISQSVPMINTEDDDSNDNTDSNNNNDDDDDSDDDT